MKFAEPQRLRETCALLRNWDAPSNYTVHDVFMAKLLPD